MLILESLVQKCTGDKKHGDASFKITGDGVSGFYCAACAHVLMKNAEGYKEARAGEETTVAPKEDKKSLSPSLKPETKKPEGGK